MPSRALIFGVLFGFVLSRVGATEYDAIRDMFTLTNLHLAGVIGLAIAVCALAFLVIRRSSAKAFRGGPMLLAKKPMTPGLVVGSLVFGVGWALSGTCPGTSLAQLGEGKLAAIATLAGMLVSSALVEAWQARGDRADALRHRVSVCVRGRRPMADSAGTR